MKLENPFYLESLNQESLTKAEPIPSSVYRPAGRETVRSFAQIPAWISEPFACVQSPAAPMTIPDATHSTLQQMVHPPSFGGRMGGSCGIDDGYGVHALESGYGRGYVFGGQQMNWIPNYAYPGYLPPSVAQPVAPCNPIPSFACRPPPLTTERVFGYTRSHIAIN